MDISIVAVVGKKNEIGRNNDLLCRLPADLKHFKELTVGHTVVMGRKTFESLPKGALPDRKNIVLTRNENLSFDHCGICSSISELIDNQPNDSEIFIIGGGEVYKQTLPLANKLYLTKIHTEFDDTDTFFPEINYADWEEVSHKDFKADEKNPYDYAFCLYQRK